MSRVVGVLVLGLVAAGLAAGCSDRTDDVAAGPGLSSDETAWVAKWSAWSEGLATALDREEQARLVVADDPAAYRGETGWLARCREHLADDVGQGPTARTDAVAARLRGICRSLERTVRRIGKAYATGANPVAAVVDGSAALGSARSAVAEVEQTLEGYSLARRTLPTLVAPADRSHRDPVLAAAAERDIEGFTTEVRCWSDAEWPAMIDEERALSNGQITIDSTGAFANTTTLQINMQQADCDELGRARASGRWWPARLDDRLDLAWALGVLAHEAQHIAGAEDEAETECRGEQRIADVAVALGAPVDRARALATLSWARLYPDIDPDYRSGLCVDGGPYDLRPGRAGRWPWG